MKGKKLRYIPLDQIYRIDNRKLMRALPDNSIDSIVCDPPYHLTSITKRFGKKNSKAATTKNNDGSFSRLSKGFMGKEWDGVDENGLGIAFDVDFWGEALRVLKPGGHLIAFSGTRTYHRMAVAIEDAGFEIRDQLQWVYNTGFPKSHDISKAMDKKAGAKREVIGRNPNSRENCDKTNTLFESGTVGKTDFITIPSTPEAKYWEGWGTALKPSFEPILLARKPISEKSIAENVLKWGTGGLNVDGCRIGNEPISTNGKMTNNVYGKYDSDKFVGGTRQGRFPANTLTLDPDSPMIESKFFTIVPKELQKKASKKDRNSKWNGMLMPIPNQHPTVKPVALMKWLVQLITPCDGVVFDPFSGSGSTLVAAKQLQQEEAYQNLSYIGAELDKEYIVIARERTC